MNTFVWVLQVLLALVFLLTGVLKLVQPREKLREQMRWVDGFSQEAIRGIGAAEVAGALGLVLPGWLDVLTWLTPLAAAGLVLVMIGAIATHLRLKEWPMVAGNAVLAVLALVVAWARFGSYPL
ncbi:DoxX family protein [Pedococcus aerophilus]|uniref:DoxX family protein n=1 Tax=Pedococcus aerophilus TaxID=436356 RepID=A0ABP6GZ55_9MICO